MRPKKTKTNKKKKKTQLVCLCSEKPQRRSSSAWRSQSPDPRDSFHKCSRNKRLLISPYRRLHPLFTCAMRHTTPRKGPIATGTLTYQNGHVICAHASVTDAGIENESTQIRCQNPKALRCTVCFFLHQIKNRLDSRGWNVSGAWLKNKGAMCFVNVFKADDLLRIRRSEWWSAV